MGPRGERDIRLKRPKISRRVRELLRKMTAPRVEQRFQHPSEIIAFLDCWAARERHRWWLQGGCLVAAVLAAYAVAAWLLLSDSDEPDVPPSDVDEVFSIPDSV